MNKNIHEARTSKDLLRRRVYQMYDRGSLGNTPFYNVTKILRYLRKNTPKREENNLSEDDIIDAANEVAKNSRKNFTPTRIMNDIEDEENDLDTDSMDSQSEIVPDDLSNQEDQSYSNMTLNPEFKSSDDFYVYSSADGSLRVACSEPELNYDGSVKKDLYIDDFTPNNIVKFMNDNPQSEDEENIVNESPQYYISNREKYKNPRNCYQELYYRINGLR